METIVVLTRKAEKDLRKLPRHILLQLDFWLEIIETDGFKAIEITH